jgi:hypothetical protein
MRTNVVALIQNLDRIIGTIACTEIYRESISFFALLLLHLVSASQLTVVIRDPSKSPAEISSSGVEIRQGDFSKRELLDSHGNESYISNLGVHEYKFGVP